MRRPQRTRALVYTERDRTPTPAEILGAHGLEVTGSGSHLIVQTPHGRVDFYPATGMWRLRGTLRASTGIFSLIRWAREQEVA